MGKAPSPPQRILDHLYDEGIHDPTVITTFLSTFGTRPEEVENVRDLLLYLSTQGYVQIWPSDLHKYLGRAADPNAGANSALVTYADIKVGITKAGEEEVERRRGKKWRVPAWLKWFADMTDLSKGLVVAALAVGGFFGVKVAVDSNQAHKPADEQGSPGVQENTPARKTNSTESDPKDPAPTQAHKPADEQGSPGVQENTPAQKTDRTELGSKDPAPTPSTTPRTRFYRDRNGDGSGNRADFVYDASAGYVRDSSDLADNDELHLDLGGYTRNWKPTPCSDGRNAFSFVVTLKDRAGRPLKDRAIQVISRTTDDKGNNLLDAINIPRDAKKRIILVTNAQGEASCTFNAPNSKEPTGKHKIIFTYSPPGKGQVRTTSEALIGICTGCKDCN